MSDETDLVNRLRQRATMLPGILPASSWQGVCAEAAAEIARLRAEVAALRAQRCDCDEPPGVGLGTRGA